MNKNIILLDGKTIDPLSKSLATTNILVSQTKIVGLGYMPDEKEEDLKKLSINGCLIFPQTVAFPSQILEKDLCLNPKKGLFSTFSIEDKNLNQVYNLVPIDRIKSQKNKATGIVLTENSPLKEAISLAKLAKVPLVCKLTNSNAETILSELEKEKVAAHLELSDANLLNLLKSKTTHQLNISTSLNLDYANTSPDIINALQSQVLNTFSCKLGQEEQWFNHIINTYKSQLKPEQLIQILSIHLHEFFNLKGWSLSINNKANLLVVDSKTNNRSQIKHVIVNGLIIE